MTGTLVLQRFEIGDRLGAGGCGTVYRAWDRRLEREVAVKVVETEPESGPRIRREAQAAARLNHPGIVTLFEFAHHEFGREGGRAFLVSELVEGETIREMIDRDLLSDREIAEIGADVCESLDHAHSRGVVHRDLKPANLISPYRDGGAKLMDFGIARLLDSDDLTRPGDVLGTLSYMAPEQAEGREVGPSGDVFSLALTLYEAWTGRNPRRRSSPSATLAALSRAVPPLSSARPDLPAELADLVDGCLDPVPEYRPGLEELGSGLEDSIAFLDDSTAGADAGRQGRGSRFDFTDPGFDPSRVFAAGGVGALVATGVVLSGSADPASVGLISLVSALVTLLDPRAGFLCGAAALAAWLALVASMPGAAAVVVTAGVVPALMIRGSGVALVAAPFGPLLGVLGLAPLLPLLAAFAVDRRDRAVVAVTGLACTALAEAITGKGLLFGAIPAAQEGWQDSVSAALAGLVIPVLTATSFLVSLLIWPLVAVLAGAVVARVRGRRGTEGGRSLALAPVGSDRVPDVR
ncbi:MAG: serine/threonine protein kinase [Solirubrobacterales bacterium]|nr:serine/threonine protein kinase [Solirubrobacterales bacterium]